MSIRVSAPPAGGMIAASRIALLGWVHPPVRRTLPSPRRTARCHPRERSPGAGRAMNLPSAVP
ncbi:MAG TPA: hypothetical protein DDZ83_08505 [Nitrospinae bacterium]|nr:hypothetical protein [Nitrospinota bacterium]